MTLKQKNTYKHLAIGILGLIGAVVILLLTFSHNTGISPDSVAYISVARNISEGNGFITYDGDYYVLQPPLYPLLLASVYQMFSIDPVVSAGYINSIFFGLIIYLSGLFFLKHLRSFALSLLGTISVMISYALVQASFMALSELLFIFLVLLFLYYLEKYQTNRDIVSLLLLSVSVSLACLTRYTGVILILTGALYIFLSGRNNKVNFRQTLIFLLISVLPIGFWIIRNYVITGTLVGQRAASSYSFFENLGFFYHTILPWFLPLNLTWIYFIFIFIILTSWIFFGLYKNQANRKELVKYLSPVIFFVIFYAGIIIISSTTTAYDKISDRLLSPIYIPAIFILFFISDKILGWLKMSIRPKLITTIFTVAIILLMRYPVYNTKYIIDEYIHASGREYSTDSWRESETIEYITGHESLGQNYTIFSNEPEAVYILTNLKTHRSPAKTFYNSAQLFNKYSNQKGFGPNPEKICLIWFDKADHSYLYTIDELQKNMAMTEVAHLNDGEIYTFSNK